MLREWLVADLIQTLQQSHLRRQDDDSDVGAIDGFFLDDYWCSDILCHETNDNPAYGCPCHDPFQGPTEVEHHVVQDTGWSDQDIYAMTLAWRETLTAMEEPLSPPHLPPKKRVFPHITQET